MKINAEIIAIGDELTSGVRLDTNSRWLSQQLESLGIHVTFHSTVGDDLPRMKQAISLASQRSNIVICTGGLGPTADDLTRQAISEVANVPIELAPDVLSRIQAMFENRGREMPANNRIQAMFPRGSKIVPNPEGTAPGIEYDFEFGQEQSAIFFALPGVPAEMKQMWHETVSPRLRERFDIRLTTAHHTLHCFGTGESAIETMLPNLIQRGRDPLVGITASAATISLRVSTRATTQEACLEKMRPTIELIRSSLGDLVFGENGEQLEDVIVRDWISRDQKLLLLDFGLHGEVARRLSTADPMGKVFEGGRTFAGPEPPMIDFLQEAKLSINCPKTRLVMIGSLNRDPDQVDSGQSFFKVKIADGEHVIGHRLRFSGHSSWREERAVKDVLNLIRLHRLN